MVRSCLIAPLVQPLVGRGTSGVGRRSAISRSRIFGTALALSALCSVSTMADAARATLESEALKSKVESTVKANAHRAPKIAAKVLLERFLAGIARRADDLVTAPSESPDFEQEGLAIARVRARLKYYSPDTARRAVDRLLAGADPTYLLFGSGVHLSGIPTS